MTTTVREYNDWTHAGSTDIYGNPVGPTKIMRLAKGRVIGELVGDVVVVERNQLGTVITYATLPDGSEWILWQVVEMAKKGERGLFWTAA